MKDRFSHQSQKYAAFRPSYPIALNEFIVSHVNDFGLAWDVGTGNGQVARDLANQFKRVLATDISANQLQNAYHAPNIEYTVAGEETSMPDRSCDLITVAQAIHWFNFDKFYREVKRVGKPKSILAVWGYGLLSIDAAIDPLLLNFYENIVGPYWDKERKLVDERYQTIPFPFEELKVPDFEFSFQWTRGELLGYLETWSSVRKYELAKGENPVEEFIREIQALWKGETKRITFPLFVRLGRI